MVQFEAERLIADRKVKLQAWRYFRPRWRMIKVLKQKVGGLSKSRQGGDCWDKWLDLTKLETFFEDGAVQKYVRN